jgi:predicted DCC family thiol-disulfide oxidoreductase YuxK
VNEPITSTTPPDVIVLFDGVCNLCAGLVQFLIPRDPTGRLTFASLQSVAGEHLKTNFGISPQDDSMIAIVDGHALLRSDAALAIGRALGGRYRLAAQASRLIPRLARDLVYRFIAQHRYRVFGKQTECWLPTPALRRRFLTDGLLQSTDVPT